MIHLALPTHPGPVPHWVHVANYERHQPEKTLLYEVVREKLETFLSNASEQGALVARFVERELRAYLDCGILARGFLRLHCDACGRDRLLAFSCRGRALCPSCGGRRMAARSRSDRSACEASLRRDTAAHLVDCVLPEVPVRQWVLSLPYPVRYSCAWDAKLTSEVLRAFMRALFAMLRLMTFWNEGVAGATLANWRPGCTLRMPLSGSP
jgi:hypothetical protein